MIAKYQFKGETYRGERVVGNLIQGKRTTFIVPPHLIFSYSSWQKVDPDTVEMVTDDDYEIKPSKITEL